MRCNVQSGRSSQKKKNWPPGLRLRSHGAIDDQYCDRGIGRLTINRDQANRIRTSMRVLGHTVGGNLPGDALESISE